MSYYVSCIGSTGNAWGFDCDSFEEAMKKADFAVCCGSAASADVLDCDDETVYYTMRS